MTCNVCVCAARACINVCLSHFCTTVQCADGGKITGITFADWGDPTAVGGSGPYDPHACEFKSAANCTSAVHTKAAIEALCVGKSKCIIETADLNQPDPCSGHHKRVAVLATGCSAMAPPKSKPTMTFTSSTGGGTLGYNNNLEDAGLDGSGKFVQNASSGPLVSRAYLPGLVSF